MGLYVELFEKKRHSSETSSKEEGTIEGSVEVWTAKAPPWWLWSLIRVNDESSNESHTKEVC
eukprot:scaffold3337_cov169-Amphora_coffeaeformis.AAC.12